MCFSIFSSASSAEDSSQTRKEALVKEYFELVSMKDMWGGMISEVVKNMPEEQKIPFQELMNNYVNLGLLEESAKDSMFRHLNEKELQTYVNFIKDPNGRSSMEKMKYYMADIIPVVQSEMKRAYTQYLTVTQNKKDKETVVEQ